MMVVQVSSKRKGSVYWIFALLFVLFFILAIFGFAADSGVGGAFCCLSIIFGIIAETSWASDKGQQVLVIQQQPQYVPVVQQQYFPAPQQVRAPVMPPPVNRVAAPVQQSPRTQQKSAAMWAADARNLELARNWEDAAEAYQKAGMFAEAGRIRQAHLEKEEQAMVQIGQVGNTVLNDSVMVAESTPKTCASCGNVSDPSWKICPHCSNPL